MVKVRLGVIDIKVITPEYTHPYNRLMIKVLRQFPADFGASHIDDLNQFNGPIFGAFNDKNELIGAVGLRSMDNC